MRHHHPSTRERGASFVETLVATALGLLVLVVSTRSVLAVVVGESRGAIAKALVESIDFARAEAAQRRSPVSICGLEPRDATASPGLVHCAAAGLPWQAGWIVYGDDNLNGELDDGEAVLQVVRAAQPTVHPDGELAAPGAVTFRPIGTLASATPRRLLLSVEGADTPVQAVCVAIDGYTRVLPLASACQ